MLNINPLTFNYIENILDVSDLNKIISYLDNINDFKSNPKYSNGQCGRQQKWYQQDMKYFCPMWNNKLDWWVSFKYDNDLLYFQNVIQKKLNDLNYNCNINSCLINKYRNGDDYISPHRDSKLSFGDKPIIAILSIGQERTLRFRKIHENNKNISITKKHKDNVFFDYKLKNNSLFIMQNDSQINYSHELIKDNSKNHRYSLTFRNFIL